MQEYTYTLNDSDYIEYLEAQAGEDKIVQVRSLTFTYLSIPVAGCIMYAMSIKNPLYYAALLAVYPLWVYLSKKIIGSIVLSIAQKTLKKNKNMKYHEILAKFRNREVEIDSNGTTRAEVCSYKLLRHVILLQLNNGDCLILPQRALHDENGMKSFLLEIS